MTTSYAYPNTASILKRLWTGVCDIYIKSSQEDQNGVTRQTAEKEHLLYESLHCDVSSDSITPASGGIVASADQKITLFLGAEYFIPLGSRIVVTQHGRTREFTNSGEPDFYRSHQEIPLKLIDTKA
ncbi:MAG: hypothetical protein LBU81_00880 [Methanosarcinales archaeon]|jgi:hypothetical protein|nr:hypothetical protein [Methanosarcinales archaeon]